MQLRKLGNTDLKIAPLVLGGNVFGWTAGRDASFAVLDAFLAAGFNAIDTADIYNRFAPGMEGGESETLLGEWMKDRGVRDKMIIITKGGLDMSYVPPATGYAVPSVSLSREYLPKACEASLKRLQTDYIDVYMSHLADANTPVGETLEAFQQLIDVGKIRYAGCSNHNAEQLGAGLAEGGGSKARYDVFQPHYNLADRENYEDNLEGICARENVGVVVYYGLASGFLTGKYRKAADIGDHARGRMLGGYLNPKGFGTLAALDAVAARHGATPAQIALAWLMARPSVTAPIASATSVAQLSEILQAVNVKLSPEDLQTLDVDNRDLVAGEA